MCRSTDLVATRFPLPWHCAVLTSLIAASLSPLPVADFYCASHRLVVELDGDSHFTAAGIRHDSARDAALTQMGLNILRFTNEDVMRRFEAVCLEIAAVLEKPKT